jgi:hypothetical protein
MLEINMAVQKPNETRAGHGDGLPPLEPSKQQYTQRIGYCFNAKRQRVRKMWNLGKDYLDACTQGIALRKTSDSVVVKQIWPTFSEDVRRVLPDYDWSKPVWPEPWMLARG